MRTLLGSLGVLSLIVACGGSTKPPELAPTEVPAASAPAAETPPPPTASADTADAGAAASATPGPAAGGPVTKDPTTGKEIPAGVIAQGHDDCAGIAAPYEEKVRAKFNECYQAGRKKNPELHGTVKITFVIDMKGKVTKINNEKSELDPKTLACMLKAAKAEPLDTKGCKGKNVTVTKTYGEK